MMGTSEVCVCAALRMRDGYVFRGHRHVDCMNTAGQWLRYTREDVRVAQQGFITTRERFVDRAEGLALQVAAGRPTASVDGQYRTQLYSEDLY